MSVTTDILGPLSSNTMRVVFLYVGQGESTLVFMPDGAGGHRTMLIDCNRGASLKGIDLTKMLTDALPMRGGDKPILDVFTNTHPHCDHLGGLDEIRKAVHIDAVWHSGHTPSSNHEGPYGELAALLREVRQRRGTERRLEASRTAESWGAGEVHVLSPAAYIVEEIENETADQRDTRIHDQCAVLRITNSADASRTSVLITGDSDKEAWIRITGYHGQSSANRLKSHVFSAPHHGSYTFFKDRADDPDPYTAHLAVIAPDRIIISAPDQKDSKHDHPHDDAVERYQQAVGKDRIHHMGSRGWSFFVDADPYGYRFSEDRGELARAFPFDENQDGNGSGGSAKKVVPYGGISRVEKSRPMGSQ